MGLFGGRKKKIKIEVHGFKLEVKGDLEEVINIGLQALMNYQKLVKTEAFSFSTRAGGD